MEESPKEIFGVTKKDCNGGTGRRQKMGIYGNGERHAEVEANFR